MPLKHTITYRETTSPILEPVTKFGGQPVWIGEPEWPLSRLYGTPMQFICQVSLDPELFGDIGPRMAYLFMTDVDQNGPYPETWDPDEGENAVILQPGGIWDGQTQPLREGPSLYKRVSLPAGGDERVPCELAVELERGTDPDEGQWNDVDSDDEESWSGYWEALTQDKLGGFAVPTINLQAPVRPGPGDWKLLLQLNTRDIDDIFFINFASDGVGYAFLSEDGRRGKFMWSR